MGGNNEFFANFERNKYLKKLPSMQRVNDHASYSNQRWPQTIDKSESLTVAQDNFIVTVSNITWSYNSSALRFGTASSLGSLFLKYSMNEGSSVSETLPCCRLTHRFE